MFDLNQVEPAELIPLRKAYALIGALSGRDHMANFGWTVELAEGTRAFHEVLDRVDTAGIKPVDFIAVHALAQCALWLKDRPPTEHFNSLADFLFDTTKDYLGQEIYDHLREWADASDAEDDGLAEKGPWAKLGAMTRSLSTLDQFNGFDADFVQKNYDLVKTEIDEHRAIAAACKGLSPALDEYYESRMQEAGRLLQPQPPAAPSGGTPQPG